MFFKKKKKFKFHSILSFTFINKLKGSVHPLLLKCVTGWRISHGSGAAAQRSAPRQCLHPPPGGHGAVPHGGGLQQSTKITIFFF